MNSVCRLPGAAVLLILCLGCHGSPADSTEEPLAVLRAFFAAFNAHDVGAMAPLLAPDVRWHSVGRESLSTEAGNRDELIAGLHRYFQDIPDVRSTMESPVVAGNRVAFRERVTWNGGTRTQASLAVYEVLDGRISAAWYFPSSP